MDESSLPQAYQRFRRTLNFHMKVGDQFLVEKSQKDEPEKTNTEAEVQSMVTIPILQDTSSVPLMTTPVMIYRPSIRFQQRFPLYAYKQQQTVTETSTQHCSTTTTSTTTRRLNLDLNSDDWSAGTEYSKSGGSKSSPGGKARQAREHNPPIRDSRLI
ncbi:hypothetical protein Tco_0104979 [Tanacetum coccineum]